MKEPWLQAFIPDDFKAMSKPISAAVSEDTLIISKSFPSSHVFSSLSMVCVIVHMWLAERKRHLVVISDL